VLCSFLAGSLISSPRVQANDNDRDGDDSKVQIGFEIAPVHLTLTGTEPRPVGKGSYIVNAQGDCNGCHNSPDLGGEWAPGHNPYFGQPKMVNVNAYLGGGSQFGPFPGKGDRWRRPADDLLPELDAGRIRAS